MHARQGGASCNRWVASMLPASRAHNAWGQGTQISSQQQWVRVGNTRRSQLCLLMQAFGDIEELKRRFLGKQLQQVGHSL